jgi:hypothetical protein
MKYVFHYVSSMIHYKSHQLLSNEVTLEVWNKVADIFTVTPPNMFSVKTIVAQSVDRILANQKP